MISITKILLFTLCGYVTDTKKLVLPSFSIENKKHRFYNQKLFYFWQYDFDCIRWQLYIIIHMITIGYIERVTTAEDNIN